MMTIPRLTALTTYWSEFPPAHIQFARLNNTILKPADAPRPRDNKGSLGDLIRDFGALGGSIA